MMTSAVADDDIITLDSGDEDEDEKPHQTSSSIAADAAFADDMSYNPANYADLLQTNAVVSAGRPYPPPLLQRGGMRPRGRGGLVAAGGLSSIKRPGQFPPFALFSQEKRKALTDSNPQMNFGDVGRQLGEMWHALSEAEKEDYRLRARVIFDQKIAVWEKQQKQMRARAMMAQRIPSSSAATAVNFGRGGQRGPRPILPRMQLQQQQQQQQFGGQQVGAGGHNGQMMQGRRRTHGYAIFSTERRKQYAQQGGISVPEMTQLVANEWRSSSPQVRQSYEARAAKINSMEDQKYQRQQQQTLMRPQQQQQVMMRQQQRQAPGLTSRTLPNLPSSTTLRISSVSSLSPVKKPAPPNINLPIGISISRVEPEISILSEQPPLPRSSPQSLLPSPRSVAAAGARLPMLHRGGVVGRGGRPPGHGAIMSMRPRGGVQQAMGVPTYRGRGGRAGVHSSLNGMGVTPRPYQQHQQMNLMNQQMVGMKRPMRGRPQVYQNDPNVAKKRRVCDTVGDFLGLGSPLAPGMVGSLNKYCRLCGESYPKNGPMYTLDERPQLLDKIHNTLSIRIDLDKDKELGYPNVACRKCCHVLFSFDDFKKKVSEGLERLDRVVALARDKGGMDENGQGGQISEESQGGYSEEVSILPDLDMEIDSADNNGFTPVTVTSRVKPVLIKEEKHAGIPTLPSASSDAFERVKDENGGEEKRNGEIKGVDDKKDEEEDESTKEKEDTKSSEETGEKNDDNDEEEEVTEGKETSSADDQAGPPANFDGPSGFLGSMSNFESGARDGEVDPMDPLDHDLLAEGDGSRPDPLSFVRVGDCQTIKDFGDVEGDLEDASSSLMNGDIGVSGEEEGEESGDQDPSSPNSPVEGVTDKERSVESESLSVEDVFADIEAEAAESLSVPPPQSLDAEVIDLDENADVDAASANDDVVQPQTPCHKEDAMSKLVERQLLTPPEASGGSRLEGAESQDGADDDVTAGEEPMSESLADESPADAQEEWSDNLSPGADMT